MMSQIGGIEILLYVMSLFWFYCGLNTLCDERNPITDRMFLALGTGCTLACAWSWLHA